MQTVKNVKNLKVTKYVYTIKSSHKNVLIVVTCGF